MSLPLRFTARGTCEPLEAALPGPVEFDQELCTDIARNVGEKGKLSTECFQLADLIKSIRIEASGTAETELSLLEREIPEKAKCGLPGQQALLLLLAGVDPKLEPLVTPHEKKNTLVCKKSKRIPPTNGDRSRGSVTRGIRTAREWRPPYPESVRRGFLPALKDGVSAQGAI